MTHQHYDEMSIFSHDVHHLNDSRLENVSLHDPSGNYMPKVNNRNTRTRCAICSQVNSLTIYFHKVNFMVNFEHISHLGLVNF